MRVQKSAPTRWFAAALLPLLVACTPTDVTQEPLILGEFQNGLITFYNADGTGNCLYDASPQDMDVAAMNIGQYQDSAVCGTCVQIEGPKGTLTVRIVDSCPDCSDKGHLDLSQSAFAKLADPIQGRVNVRWRMVSCDNVQGPLRYRFKEGSNPYWAGIQVFNHRLPVTKLEFSKNGVWVPVKREPYNYFIEPTGMGSGAIKLRVTALSGQVLEDTLPGVVRDNTVIFEGAAQFKAN